MNTASEFVINGSILDSRAYGQFYRDAANSVGGTAYYYLGNHLTWTPSVASGTPAWEYYVCAKRAGESFFHLIGQTTPSVPGGWSDTQFDDFGSPFMDKQHYPAYIETVAEAAFNAANPVTSAADAICTSVAPTPDPLTTIITSGAGTGTLRVRDASSSAIEKNGTILYDAAPNILAAATYMARAGGGSNSAGVLYFPPASNSPAASGYP